MKKRKIIKIKKPAKPVVQKSQETSIPVVTDGLFKAKIRVIGVGGGGGSIVSDIGRSLNKVTYVVADTDARAFRKKPGVKQFLFGQNLTHGLGTGVNPELGKLAAQQAVGTFSQFLKGQDIIIFVASLGGGLGSGATPEFVRAAKDFDGITLGIFTLPFKFEGQNKHRIAFKALKELRGLLNVSITMSNERIFKVIDANTAVTSAFSMVNKNLIESLEGLIDLIYSPGIINIDFADLRAILNGRGNLAFLNTAQTQGKNRAEIMVEKILNNPLYYSNNFKPEKILFSIPGGDKLNMFEVDRISRAISALNPNAKIIFGVSKVPKLKEKIKTILLMTGGGVQVTETASIKALQKNQTPPPKKTDTVALQPKPAKSAAKARPLAVKATVPVKKVSLLKSVFGAKSVEENRPNPPAGGASKKIKVVEAKADKKAIRRTALEVKKAEEEAEDRQSQQEKEWEIPAFLRLKKH